jgi:hypothetical protein
LKAISGKEFCRLLEQRGWQNALPEAIQQIIEAPDRWPVLESELQMGPYQMQ